jgi:hypothetical protein
MERNEMFIRIPIAALLDNRLSRSALIVYAIMIDAADKWGMLEGMTIAEMAARSGLNEKTVRRSEAQLAAAGYIAIHRTGRASTVEVLHNLRPMIRSGIDYYRNQEEGTA